MAGCGPACGAVGSGGVGELDLVAELFELVDEPVGVDLLVAGVELEVEVTAEFVVGDVTVEQVVGDDQDGVADRDGGLLGSSPSAEPGVLGGEVGVFGSRGGVGGFSPPAWTRPTSTRPATGTPSPPRPATPTRNSVSGGSSPPAWTRPSSTRPATGTPSPPKPATPPPRTTSGCCSPPC
jgi:hypothetical protein